MRDNSTVDENILIVEKIADSLVSNPDFMVMNNASFDKQKGSKSKTPPTLLEAILLIASDNPKMLTQLNQVVDGEELGAFVSVVTGQDSACCAPFLSKNGGNSDSIIKGAMGSGGDKVFNKAVSVLNAAIESGLPKDVDCARATNEGRGSGRNCITNI